MFQINIENDSFVVKKVSEEFGHSVDRFSQEADMLVFWVMKERLLDLLQFLRDDNQLQFNFLTTLCGMHYPETNQLGVVYHLHSFTNNHRIRIKTATPLENPMIPSITSLWPSANWMERETYDFFGIIFEGHPRLLRILNVDDMVDFPLRKDFPLEDQTRDDKDDSMFGR